jgi:tripartite-type tricarboxylate transporter receptor subunit TctC
MFVRQLILLALLLAGPIPTLALAQDRPPRIIAGFAPGGTGDLVARLIAEALAPGLGVRPLVENRTGANGLLAAEAVARGPADGSVLLQCPMGTLTISPELPGAVLPIDPRTELVPVSNIALSSYGAVTGARGPHRTMAELVAAARARPGTISYASAGVGSAQHLTGARLAAMAGLDLVHVAYRGAAPAALDVIAGRTDLLITNLGDVVRQIQGGELRLLALADAAGVPNSPERPAWPTPCRDWKWRAGSACAARAACPQRRSGAGPRRRKRRCATRPSVSA